MHLRRASGVGTLVLAIAWATVVACGDESGSVFGPGSDDGGGDGGGGPAPSFPSTTEDVFNGPWTDFPAEPIVDNAALDGGAATPADAPALFAGGTPGTGDGSSPCLMEPEVGSMVPKNWLRPRFRWTTAGPENLFEIRVHVDNQVNDLVVYTSSSQWTMPAAMWTNLAMHSAGVGITLGVRGGTLAGGAVTGITAGSTGPWAIAPADAPGSVVYWRIVGDGKADLKGFTVGEESVGVALDPAKVEQKSGTQCVGCHSSSPDGKFAIFSSDSFSGYGLGIASIEATTSGKKPDFLTPQGAAALETHLKGVNTMAAPFWVPGKHLVVASGGSELRWANLDATDDATAKGVIATTGDTRTRPNSPNLSHDGATIIYVSGNEATDGRPVGGANDIYMVPFNGGAGGAAAPVSGAATAEFNEYYPSFSPDDKLIAFNRIPAGQGPYSAPNAEVFVISSAGGDPARLASNDPPACSKTTSPGIENSWPKWAPAKPAPVTVNGNTYYWLVFSSTRFGGDKRQLFMAPVVVDKTGKVTSYKAVYPWNQPEDEKNHTPAWDVFAIPPSPPSVPK
jgi:hypothetical protein